MWLRVAYVVVYMLRLFVACAVVVEWMLAVDVAALLCELAPLRLQEARYLTERWEGALVVDLGSVACVINALLTTATHFSLKYHTYLLILLFSLFMNVKYLPMEHLRCDNDHLCHRQYHVVHEDVLHVQRRGYHARVHQCLVCSSR